MKSTLLAFTSALTICTPLAAEPSDGPQPYPMPPAIAAPRDVAWPGVIRLEVDASDTARRIFQVKQTLPGVKTGRLTLLYPEWLPGKHYDFGSIDKLAGLVVRGNDKVLAWVRDPVNVFAFHVDVPQGVSELKIEFQFVSPTAANQGRVVVTPEMLNLQWGMVALYPAGYYTRRSMVEPSVKLPAGWNYGVALDTASRDGDIARFKPITLETLVDSPMVAGRYFKQYDLDPGAKYPVRMNVIADTPAELAADAKTLDKHKALIQQADKLFGVRNFDRYDFLVAITDRLGDIGLEHHRSSENGVATGYFTEFDQAIGDRGLLPHEYVHSWNGKYRRPAELWTPSFNVPMRGSLLWVYEGLTSYWGDVLGARSGMSSKQESLESLALTAAQYENQTGRRWRQLEDTTFDPILARRLPQPWRGYQRSEDYYQEGLLIWLDADTLIREKSGGRKSLDDFGRQFFAGKDGQYVVSPYTFDDVVTALNAVQPHDWATFLTARVKDVAPSAPLDSLARTGWKLVYTDTPTAYVKAVEGVSKSTGLTYSLGLSLSRDADVTGVLWEGPAFNAGITVSTKVLAVNGFAFSTERLKAAITEGKTGKPIELLVRNGDHFRTVSIPYAGGLRYPKLERIDGTPDMLSRIFEARK